jgi:hypothetical protein
MRTVTPQIRRAVAPPAPVPPGRVAGPATPVELHLDAVVFHGFSRSDGHRAAAALQHELARLVTAHGMPASLPAAPGRLDAGPIRAVAGRPELTGIRAARAIHRSLRA